MERPITINLSQPDKISIEKISSLLILGLGLTTSALYFFPPLSRPLKNLYQINFGQNQSSMIKTENTDWLEGIAPTLNRGIVIGDKIGGYEVSSAYLPCLTANKSDCRNGTAHNGVDFAMPIGTQLYTVGKPGTKIKVECKEQPSGAGLYAILSPKNTNLSFVTMHLSKCIPGNYEPGKIFGLSGNTGKSTGPHLHLEQGFLNQQNQFIREQPQFIWGFQMITGELPKPIFKRSL